MLIYSQITFQELRHRFGITVENESFLPPVTPVALPDWLRAYLAINQLSPALAKSEKAVSEMLIAPVLSAVKENNLDKIALFSGEALTLPGELSGICDFIIAANPKAFLPEPPIMVLVEAKRQDLYSGIPQCVGEMLAARSTNERVNIDFDAVYGCVTTGNEWLFLQLNGNRAITDPTILYYPELEKVLGVFQWIISQFTVKSAEIRAK
ncbi:hypothetical protein [Spirosoma rhododendri]|uniref:Uncharacterized protein n=1 Tax=Spirosoma rhododendri TaxID=2728024 RepID=A0A7L5DNZ9_9BACT|nr:hypothetical protein [Spirosoma rhododendri]QJD77787.1 hypothetical protein HH216_04625 [Spirosoma rhododendri]